MSNAWETTTNDVELVFQVHNIKFANEDVQRVFDALNHDLIEEGVLQYTDMEEQTDSMCDDIENKMIELGYIEANAKIYHSP